MTDRVGKVDNLKAENYCSPFSARIILKCYL